jgi:hypothetical protein
MGQVLNQDSFRSRPPYENLNTIQWHRAEFKALAEIVGTFLYDFV